MLHDAADREGQAFTADVADLAGLIEAAPGERGR